MPSLPEKILILRGGALGDFVLTLPLLRCVRNAFPSARLELLAYPDIATLALRNGLADDVRRVDAALFVPLFSPSPQATPELRAYLGGFTRTLAVWHDPMGIVREALAACGAKAALTVDPIPPPGKRVHATDFMLSQLPESWRRPSPAPEVRPAAEDREWAGALLGEGLGLEAARRVAIHPGSGGRGDNRNWPPDRFARLVAELRRVRDTAPFVIRGPADDAAVRQMVSADPAADFRVASELTVPRLAAVLAEARGFVGNDSGVAHLAAAVGTRTVAIFGQTDSVVWAPRGRDVRVLEPARGPDGSPGRIEMITVERVLAALTEARPVTGRP